MTLRVTTADPAASAATAFALDPRGSHASATQGRTRPPPRALCAAGLFAGIGGFECGLAAAGHRIREMCENWSPARAVLAHRFPDVRLHGDVASVERLDDEVDLVTAGFPCTDLSQAGTLAGIGGDKSGLVREVFRLLAARRHRSRPVDWVVIENVPFMLRLAKGHAMDVIADEFERLGYRWAYRIVNSNAFGVPQRRERVYFVACMEQVGDPRDVLFVDDVGEPEPPVAETWREFACGFYWTEGNRGLGWAVDRIPTLKGGSSIGLQSQPAVIRASGAIITPDIRDAERMQGFPADWTIAAEQGSARNPRGKLVGNAVTVNAAAWLGSRLATPGRYDAAADRPLSRPEPWPRAAWGSGGLRGVAAVSAWPEHRRVGLEQFLEHEGQPLSHKATSGFHDRASVSGLRLPVGFLDVVREHRDRMVPVAG